MTDTCKAGHKFLTGQKWFWEWKRSVFRASRFYVSRFFGSCVIYFILARNTQLTNGSSPRAFLQQSGLTCVREPGWHAAWLKPQTLRQCHTSVKIFPECLQHFLQKLEQTPTCTLVQLLCWNAWKHFSHTRRKDRPWSVSIHRISASSVCKTTPALRADDLPQKDDATKLPDL